MDRYRKSTTFSEVSDKKAYANNRSVFILSLKTLSDDDL